jgi:hypothetical protein
VQDAGSEAEAFGVVCGVEDLTLDLAMLASTAANLEEIIPSSGPVSAAVGPPLWICWVCSSAELRR